MQLLIRMTRALPVALALLALASAATAQDPRNTVVQAAARQWLSTADSMDGQATWKLAGAKFRNAISADKWTEALRAVRGPLGAVQQRASVGTRFANEIPGAPPGEYALVQYRTAYEKRAEGHETVTLEHEPDGVWRVVGYFIR